MRFLRRIAGIFGLGRDDAAHNEGSDGAGEGGGDDRAAEGAARRRGFSVQVPVAVDRSAAAGGGGPVLVPSDLGDGGVQGFKWYTRRLRIDEDGDVADEFLDEILPEISSDSSRTQIAAAPKFQVKYNTRPIALAVRKQTVAPNGNIYQSLEHQGQLKWV
ncbi:uncharacterized protein LOC109712314 [Ananas comosus]|uniref:Uncharacterized protein LOC109712314 n=1 Tax=Ananas comosus TaxID=4615 RepID=A0A6P5F5X9_ANACO|nr:uncharacterized protein LOC109712314 [Ananas comosus]